MNFKEIARKETTLSDLMVGTKLTTAELVKSFPDGVTINAVDVIETEEAHYCVVTFEEIGNAFYTGGKILTKIVDAWLNEFGGDVAMCNHDLVECGGVKVRFTESKTKDNKNVTVVEVI